MISIVMPVHNTGSILKDSIGSIIKQKYEDWELILIDDASDDAETRSYISDYCYHDNRIQCVWSKERRGAAKSRNKGLESATGEYIICLDSDDFFFPEMLSEMFNSINEWGAELCICDFMSFDDGSGTVWEDGHIVHASGITDRAFQLKELGERGLLYWWMSPWEMLCRRSLIEKNGIRFQDIPCCNDVFYGAMCAQIANRIVYANHGLPLMKYRTGRKGSISGNRHPKYAFEAVMAVASRIKDKKSIEYRQLMVFLCECSMMLFFAYEKEDAIEYYDYLRKFIIQNMDSWNIKEEDSIRRMGYFIDNSYDSKWFKRIADGGYFW